MHTSRIYPNVQFGANVQIGDFCIIGCPPQGVAEGELETIIGDNSVIRSHTVIYAGNKIGSHFQTGHHVVIRESNQIGDHVSVGSLSCVEHHVLIESGVRLHSQCFVPEFSILKQNAWVGPKCTLTNARYPKSPNAKHNLVGPTLEESVKVGANCTILPGVRLGRNALIGAGSLVTKDVPANAISVGHPAKTIGKVQDIKDYEQT